MTTKVINAYKHNISRAAYYEASKMTCSTQAEHEHADEMSIYFYHIAHAFADLLDIEEQERLTDYLTELKHQEELQKLLFHAEDIVKRADAREIEQLTFEAVKRETMHCLQ